jgi:alkylation response protein AidB-like acyl-CoA dehydrogenase
VRAVLERECPTALVREIVENGSAPEQPWKSARELGWTAIDAPEALGALELGFQQLGLVVEQHGRFIAPGPFLATITHFLPLVCAAGDAHEQERFGGPAASGEITGAVAIDHGRAAEHALGDALRARADGRAWVLEGEREFVLDGDQADEIAVAARVDAGDGVGLFVVPQGAAKAQRVVALDASRPLAHLLFEGVRVEPERVLGTPGSSARALGRALEQATVAAALECVGTCQGLMELTIEHARNRREVPQRGTRVAGREPAHARGDARRARDQPRTPHQLVEALAAAPLRCGAARARLAARARRPQPPSRAATGLPRGDGEDPADAQQQSPGPGDRRPLDPRLRQ